MLFGAGGVTRTHDLLITKCIGVLHLTVFRDFGAFPLGILREVRPILLDHLDKLVLAGKPSAVIAFPLQNAPEALHRTVVNTMRHTGHTLRHACLYELVVESAVGVLEPSVAMKQGLCVRIGLHRFVEGFENQRIIVAFAEYIGHNTPVTKI